MLCLIVTHENDTRRFELSTGTFRLGSSPYNDFVVPFPGVSRHHARVETGLDDAVLLVDLQSKNGLRVDGERVASIQLRPGLEVQLGRAQLALDEAPTSNLEVARAMDPPAGAKAGTGLTREASSTTVRALRLVREIEHLGPKAQPRELAAIFDQSIELVGAQTLLLASLHAGEVSLTVLAGDPPDDRVRHQLEARIREPQGRQTVATVHDGEERELGIFLPPFDGDAARLIAIFSNQRAALSPWRRDFIGYLARSLGAPSIKRWLLVQRSDQSVKVRVPIEPLR